MAWCPPGAGGQRASRSPTLTTPREPAVAERIPNQKLASGTVNRFTRWRRWSQSGSPSLKAPMANATRIVTAQGRHAEQSDYAVEGPVPVDRPVLMPCGGSSRRHARRVTAMLGSPTSRNAARHPYLAVDGMEHVDREQHSEARSDPVRPPGPVDRSWHQRLRPLSYHRGPRVDGARPPGCPGRPH
jgi:hypothetical protein